MGHIVAKDIHSKLAKKIDGLTLRAPNNEAFYNILKALYSEEEADLIVRMPYRFSSLNRISRVANYNREKVEPILDRLAEKGLVVDVYMRDKRFFMISPIAIGIFEFTMMRTGDNPDSKGWARLFHEFIQGSDEFYAANCGRGQKISLMRTIPHEESVHSSSYVEILDYEKAGAIIDSAKKFSIGLCSCRHEKTHVKEKTCDTPMDNCTAIGMAADYLIRHNMAKEVSKEQMMDNLQRSKELGLVLNADNVQRNISYMCHCCGCCCNVLLGINNYGYSNMVMTSNYIADPALEECIGCGKCVKACPINAIGMETTAESDKLPKQVKKKKKSMPIIDRSICLGCGVCALFCKTGAMSLVRREQQIIYPETTFQRVVLQTLEQGTLQNQLFDDPQKVTHKFMRGFVGAFINLPQVKKTLLSDMFRSRFLRAMESRVRRQGKAAETQKG